MRDTVREAEFGGIVCPNCFIELAVGDRTASQFRLTAENHVPLAGVNADGKVWDDEAWLWVDPTPLP